MIQLINFDQNRSLGPSELFIPLFFTIINISIDNDHSGEMYVSKTFCVYKFNDTFHKLFFQ